MALDYADRCERYARQRGWTYDPHRISIDHLTPTQKRRALKKERHQSPHSWDCCHGYTCYQCYCHECTGESLGDPSY